MNFLQIFSKSLGKDNSLKQKRIRRIIIKRFFLNNLLTIAGAISAMIGLTGFLIPNHFIDGGVTGISMLAASFFNIPLSYLIIGINLPFIFIGYRILGFNFAVKTIIAILLLAIFVFFSPLQTITSDKILASLFGGFFLGLGIGLCIRGGSVIDGTEVVSLAISRKTNLSIGDIILIINLFIFGAAAILMNIETALYSVLTYLSASKTVDFVITGIEEYTGVTIISIRSDDIRMMIIETMGRGVTIYEGKRGFGKRGHQLEKHDIVYTVITRLEISKLKIEIEKIDPSAFVVMHSVNDTKGGMIKKRPLQNFHTFAKPKSKE